MSPDQRTEQSYTVVFMADIKVSAEDIREADDNLRQAIQNQIGHTGAAVLDIEDDGGCPL